TSRTSAALVRDPDESGAGGWPDDTVNRKAVGPLEVLHRLDSHRSTDPIDGKVVIPQFFQDFLIPPNIIRVLDRGGGRIPAELNHVGFFAPPPNEAGEPTTVGRDGGDTDKVRRLHHITCSQSLG